jgi:hypothetical protein
MIKISSTTIAKNKWDLVYLFGADRLYITNKISKNAIPSETSADVTVFLLPDKKPSGIIIDNVLRNYKKYKEFSELISFINEKSDVSSVKIPNKISFTRPLIKIINSSL